MEESAKSSLGSQKETVKACKEALKAATEANKASKEVLTAANAAVKDFATELQGITDEKAHIDKVYSENFLVMKTAESVSAGDAKSHVKEISNTLKKISCEPSLQLALTPAFKKQVAERGDFDKIAIDGVEDHFKSKIASLAEEIANAGKTKAAKDGAAAEAQTAHDATEAKRQECIAALKAAQDTQVEKENALSAAEKNVEATTKAASKALKENAHEQHGLDKAKGNLASFQFLLERVTPPEPEEPEPVEPSQMTKG